jgi:hypothetical protein
MANASKRKRQRRAKARQLRRERRAQMAKFPWRWFLMLSPTGKFFVGISTVLSLVLAYYAFAPKISVSSGAQVSDPWDCPFIIKNESLFSLHSLSFAYGVVKFEMTNAASISKLSLVRKELPVSELRPNESTSVTIPRPVTNPMERGDVIIRITYRASVLPFSWHYEARFVTVKVERQWFMWVPAARSDAPKD